MTFRHHPFLHMLLLCSMFMACQQSQEREIIPRKVMEEVLLEYHLADAIVDSKGGALVQRKILREELMDELLDKEGFNRDLFYRSYQYYLVRPVEFDSIYSNILERLQHMQDSIQAPELINRPSNRDSMLNLKPDRLKKRSKKS